MQATLFVHFLPQFVSEAELAGGAVVMIDLLRASTTISQALASGAKNVTAFLEVSEVAQAAEQHGDRDQLILAGERDCQLIEGFDLGNSPAEFTADAVFGRSVFFTTTNGTRALQHARLAERVVVGAIVNLSAVVEVLQQEQAVHLLCAGTNGHVTREDQLAAGAIAHKLLLKGERDVNDQARQVVGEWQELLNTARALGRSVDKQLALELRETPGGKNLIGVGMESDLPLCSAVDSINLVPIFDSITGQITAL